MSRIAGNHSHEGASPLAAAFILSVALTSCPGANAQSNAQEQAPTIRVNVDRVNVGVIVTNRDGNFVDGLRREDFRVFDNGVEQPITDFLSVTEPAQVLLFIESGPAVVFLGRDHLRAADKLLSNLSSGDRMAIASYSKDPELLLDFTADKVAARFALDNLNFMLGFGELNLSSGVASAIDPRFDARLYHVFRTIANSHARAYSQQRLAVASEMPGNCDASSILECRCRLLFIFNSKI